MNKLSLKLEDLAVESFSTRGDAGQRGTVNGNNWILTVGAGCGSDQYGSGCCWVSDTQCPGSGDDTYCCPSPANPRSGAPSCANTCGITGIPYKCADGCGSVDY